MYAHRTIRPIHGRHLEIELPEEFTGCTEAEVIILPVVAVAKSEDTWARRVTALAGTLGDDFPDDIVDDDLAEDLVRESLG